MFGAAVPDADIARQRAVGDDVRTQHPVAPEVAAQEQGAGAGREVEHEGHGRIPEVDQVAVAVAADDHHGGDVRVGDQHVLGDLDRRHAGVAALLDVYAPGAVGADALLDVDGRGGQRIFLPLLAHAEDQIYLQRIDAAACDGIQRGPGTHLLGAVLGTGDALPDYAELVSHGRLAPVSARGRGDVRRAHAAFRQIEAVAEDSNIVHDYSVRAAILLSRLRTSTSASPSQTRRPSAAQTRVERLTSSFAARRRVMVTVAVKASPGWAAEG
jgi:hypothetical protein